MCDRNAEVHLLLIVQRSSETVLISEPIGAVSAVVELETSKVMASLEASDLLAAAVRTLVQSGSSRGGAFTV